MISVHILRKFVLVAVAAATTLASTLFAPRVHASSPPPPNLPIKISFLTHPSSNQIKDHKVRMKMWYNDTVIFDQTVDYQKDFVPKETPANFRPGGTLKFELTVINNAGQEVKKNARTYSDGFKGGTQWLGGQVFSPDGKVTQIWTNGFNAEIYGFLGLQFSIDHRYY